MPGTLQPSPVVRKQQEHLAEEGGFGTAHKVNLTRSRRRIYFAIFVNLLVLAELTVAMYIASQHPDDFTAVFFEVLLTLLVPTIIGVIIAKRVIAKAERPERTAIQPGSSPYSTLAAAPTSDTDPSKSDSSAWPVADSASAVCSSGLSLSQARRLLARSYLIGCISAFIFMIAVAGALDSLQSLIRHEFNAINLVPGESVLVSGMMPADADTHEDLEISIEGEPGLSLRPLATYRGFWFGGHMWRAELVADLDMQPGNAVITVKEIIPLPAAKGETQSLDARDRSILFGGRQNPALVYGITIWSSAAERRANDNSLFRRHTGFPAFGVTVVAIFLAVGVGMINWRVFGRAETALAEHGVFFIHGIKEQPIPDAGARALSGYKTAFARADRSFTKDETVILLDRAWKEQSRGRVTEMDTVKAYAMFPQGGVKPQYGWLVRKENVSWTFKDV